MNRQVIALIKQTETGATIEQQGDLLETLSNEHCLVRFGAPAEHKRVLPLSALVPFCFFDNVGQLVDLMNKLNPQPSDPKTSGEIHNSAE